MRILFVHNYYGLAAPSGENKVFEAERAIILEDDCIPEAEFFPWVEKMLDRYKDEDRVLSVGGTNLRPKLCNQNEDAVFSKYAMIWGWATWRREWKKKTIKICCRFMKQKRNIT